MLPRGVHYVILVAGFLYPKNLIIKTHMKNKLNEIFSQRIGRLKYFAQMFAVGTLLTLQDMYGVLEFLFGTLLADITALMLMVYAVLLVLQRLNDLGWSRWIILVIPGGGVLTLIVPATGLVVGPLILIFLAVPLLFRKGKEVIVDAVPTNVSKNNLTEV
jgi:uncharacterized membrane protein YhaH (DUF805 family)